MLEYKIIETNQEIEVSLARCVSTILPEYKSWNIVILGEDGEVTNIVHCSKSKSYIMGLWNRRFKYVVWEKPFDFTGPVRINKYNENRG
jgi:hypothetical protein